MLEPTYGQAITGAWRLVWHHKTLWVLGLLSIAVGHFGLNTFVGMLLNLADANFLLASWWPENAPVITVSGSEGLLWVVWLCLVLGAVAIFVAVVAVLSQGALIAASGEWFRKRSSPNMSRAWRKGVKHFWRLLGVDLIQKVLLGGVLIILALLLRGISTETTQGFLLVVIISTVGLLFAVAISSSTIYAAGYVVEKELPLGQALVEGWRMFEHHLLVSTEMSLVLLVLNLAVLALVFFGSVLTIAPTLILSLIAGFTGSGALIALSVTVGGFLLVLFIALCGALFNALTVSAWMYLFMKMHHRGVTSRILHWLKFAR